MTIPVGGIAPIVLTVLLISEGESSADLLPHLMKILHGLIEQQIQIVSYACDGTKLEWKVQQLILGEAGNQIKDSIKNPQEGMPDTNIMILVINNQPICFIQDSKHTLKTLQNNLFSGAQLSTLGNYTMLCTTIHNLTFSNGSLLYH